MGVNKRPAEEQLTGEMLDCAALDQPMMDEAAAGKDFTEDDVDMDSAMMAPPSAKKAKKAKKTPAKKKKKSGLLGLANPMVPKNPVALLNELRQAVKFDMISQSGPVHNPCFTMRVEVDGATFVGEGRSKKRAKLVAAKHALAALVAQHPQQSQQILSPFPAIEFNRGVGVTAVEVDFTSDDPTDANFIINEMNRIQTTANQIFPEQLLPMPLTTLPNGVTRPQATTGKEIETKCLDDSGQGEEEEGIEEEEQEMDENPLNFHELRLEDEGDVEITAEILEIIRISVENYEEFSDTVDAAKKKLICPEKGPVMLLYELFTDIQFECVQTDGGQFSRFKMRVKVNDEVFEGTGPSKRLAKTAAAKAALAQLRNISYSPMQSRQPSEAVPMDATESYGSELPQILADGIGKLVQEKFAELMVGQEMYAKRKVLAGIVMTENGQLDGAKVISVSTGTKCINGEHISITGSVVNDCHAEIISRRCLMVFLYSQLRLLTSEETKESSIFEPCPEQPEIHQLKKGIEFHLYINTAPCGDARIFSPHDPENNGSVDKHPNRKARGQLRTKIESGEGTIPAKNNSGLQTWDGVIQGQRLLTMSCSDKIAKWNVLGIQGSLLASLVRPIYLSSIVLGSLLHPGHMYRAVCGRVEAAMANGAGLASPYAVNRPKLALVTSAETRNQLKAPNFSVNWTCGDDEVEVINSVTGKTVQSQVSRISKQMFIVRFMSAAQRLLSQPPKLESDYGELKAASREYQGVKEQLYKAFEKEDLGTWLKKPVEQDQFQVPH